MGLLKIAARVAANAIPGRDTVEKALVAAWQSIIQPYADFNEDMTARGGVGTPQIPGSKNSKDIEIGSWHFVMKIEHEEWTDEYGPDEGDRIILKFMNPITKSSDVIYEGPSQTLGLSDDDVNEMVDAAFDVLAVAASSGQALN